MFTTLLFYLKTLSLKELHQGASQLQVTPLTQQFANKYQSGSFEKIAQFRFYKLSMILLGHFDDAG